MEATYVKQQETAVYREVHLKLWVKKREEFMSMSEERQISVNKSRNLFQVEEGAKDRCPFPELQVEIVEWFTGFT
jgi:hypothetical protein